MKTVPVYIPRALCQSYLTEAHNPRRSSVRSMASLLRTKRTLALPAYCLGSPSSTWCAGDPENSTGRGRQGRWSHLGTWVTVFKAQLSHSFGDLVHASPQSRASGSLSAKQAESLLHVVVGRVWMLLSSEGRQFFCKRETLTFRKRTPG